MKQIGTLNALQFPLRDLPEMFGILPLSQKQLIHKIIWLISQRNNSRRCISMNSQRLSAFQCWKTSFKAEVCSCSGYLSEAMRWIKEGQVTDSVDDLKTSQSIRGDRFPNIQTLDAKIASSLEEILKNSHCRKRVSLAE